MPNEINQSQTEQDDRGILERLMDENPLIKSGVKKIQENQDAHIDEAMQSGVPSTEILKQLIVQHAPSAFNQGGIQTDQQGQMTGYTMPGWFADLFTPGGARGPQQLAQQGALTNIQTKQQEIVSQPTELALKQAQTTNLLASASKDKAMAEALTKNPIQHINQNTGQPTTADDPDAITTMMLPNGQYMQLDKTADLKVTADAFNKRYTDLANWQKAHPFAAKQANEEMKDLSSKIIEINNRIAAKSKIGSSGKIGKSGFKEFDSEAEVEKANLPKGTIIIIRGRKARIK